MIEREQHVNDKTVTWTLMLTIFHRRIKLSWHGPAHVYDPETPDYLRNGWEGDEE